MDDIKTGRKKPGRPKNDPDNNRKAVTIRLHPDTIATLKSYGRSQGKVIDMAIRAFAADNPPEYFR